ncbi:MAG: glycosyltransferase [Bacteroidota bacterium]|nr:glycosyltransferase [Bacteroidota bacterium]
MRRVLVIAYYFPPMGLSGVQRIAGFVRHLPACGWEPTVLTVRPAGYFAYDESLLDPLKETGVRVIRTRSLDPTRLFRKRRVVALPRESARRRLAGISEWVFVPDNKIGWLPFALAAGGQLVKEFSFDAIFSSAPPYTAHLIGAGLSRRTGIPLVVDYRDDWVENPRHSNPTRLHQVLHARLERRVVRQSRAVLTINDPIRRLILERNPEARVQVIPHGHDIAHPVPTAPRSDDKLQLLYTGVFYDVQTPDYFLKGLRRFLDSCPEARGRVEVMFAGVYPEASKGLIRLLDLSDSVHLLGYLPHMEVLELQHQADVLWMTIGTRRGSEGITTGKLSEYIGHRKPILALIPEGTAKETLTCYRAAIFAPPEDVPAIAAALAGIFRNWVSGTLPKPDETFAQSLSRSRLTRMLAATLGYGQ